MKSIALESRKEVRKTNKEQKHERSGLLLAITSLSQEFLRPPITHQTGLIESKGDDGGGEGSDGSEGGGDY